MSILFYVTIIANKYKRRHIFWVFCCIKSGD
nr:MAG TPA: hypothetical protein [Bacteriophage sp.]